ncbi:hypothetical protein OH749_31305 (plasmid) [Streptomyces albidoflavus]|uniref:hypothetical protein n=1 Tax=Streptomyces albidoflavus TaxID=1886 RepID=UPI002F90B072|nr:hypothetical protein OH749_31305 [Streptomyces albidoflavus]
MATTCVFCGGRAGSSEHVLPLWLRRQVPEEFAKADGTRTIRTRQGELRLIAERFATATVKCVCSTCNNGWMSTLETRVKPFLYQVMTGEPVTLGPDEQTALATWAMKTSMMMVRSSVLDDLTLIPRADYVQLHRYGQPSMRRTTARALRVEPPGDERQHQWGVFHGARVGGRVNGYSVILRTGALAVQFTSLRLGPGYETARYGESVKQLRLWPPTEAFSWPPAPTLNDDLVSMHPARVWAKKRPD